MLSSAPCLQQPKLQLPFLATHHQPKADTLSPSPPCTGLQRHFAHMATALLTDTMPRTCQAKAAAASSPDRRRGGEGFRWRSMSMATAGAPGTSVLAGAGAVGRRRREEEEGAARHAHRRTVSALYAELAALLPNLPSGRASRQEIVDAAVAQVKVLEDTVAVLEAYRGVQGRRGPDPVVSVSGGGGGTTCFSARLPAPRPGALRCVLEAFERRGVEVLVAAMARHGDGGAVVTVTAAAAASEVVEMIRADIARVD